MAPVSGSSIPGSQHDIEHEGRFGEGVDVLLAIFLILAFAHSRFGEIGSAMSDGCYVGWRGLDRRALAKRCWPANGSLVKYYS